MKKCICKRFKEAVVSNEIKSGPITEQCSKCGAEKSKIPIEIIYSLFLVEGIESRIFYCCWCGGTL